MSRGGPKCLPELKRLRNARAAMTAILDQYSSLMYGKRDFDLGGRLIIRNGNPKAAERFITRMYKKMFSSRQTSNHAWNRFRVFNVLESRDLLSAGIKLSPKMKQNYKACLKGEMSLLHYDIFAVLDIQSRFRGVHGDPETLEKVYSELSEEPATEKEGEEIMAKKVTVVASKKAIKIVKKAAAPSKGGLWASYESTDVRALNARVYNIIAGNSKTKFSDDAIRAKLLKEFPFAKERIGHPQWIHNRRYNVNSGRVASAQVSKAVPEYDKAGNVIPTGKPKATPKAKVAKKVVQKSPAVKKIIKETTAPTAVIKKILLKKLPAKITE